jgi:hypothetical protein
MSKSNTPPPTNRHMPAVHALGHPGSPAPQTAWGRTGRGRAGQTIVPATVVTLPLTRYSPNTPSAASLAHGNGSDLIVTWAVPAIDSTHNAATGFALRSSPTGAAVWTTVSGVTSPYNLSGLAAGAAIDVQLNSSNVTGTSAWSATSTLTTTAAGPFAPNAPAITSVAPPPDGTNTRLTVTWGAPAIDSTHGAATGFNVRSSPTGAAPGRQ